MKRIKYLPTLLALTFLFCVGTVDAQVKKVDAKQQKLEQIATSDAKKNTTTQTTNQVKDLKVVSTQIGKVNTKVAQLKGTPSASNAKKTNNVNNLKLVPVYGAKANSVSPTKLKENVSTNKKATFHAKSSRKVINRPD